MKKLTIICVGYNESLNLPKFFLAIEKAREFLDICIIYIDQTSTDDSVQIAKSYTKNIHIHPNKGYADPDKKWAVDTLIQDDELCMILDADDELSIDLAREIANIDVKVGLSSRHILFMGRSIQLSTEPRIFYRKFITITDKIHDYLHYNNIADTTRLRSIIISDDEKTKGREIPALLSKIDKYSDNEIRTNGKYTTIYYMVLMPIIYFFGFGIRHKNFLRGIPGLIHATLMGYYQFIIYAKHYEKLVTKK